MASNGFFSWFSQWGAPQSAPLSPALREIKQLLYVQDLILYYIKQIDSMLPCICPLIDHRGRQNVVRTSVTHSAIASCATFLFLQHFDVICDLVKDRCTATWNLFVKYTTQVNSAFRALWLVNSGVISKYYSPPSNRRERFSTFSTYIRVVNTVEINSARAPA